MKYAATYEANGKSYGFKQGLKNTWNWEQGENDAGPFLTFEEALENAKRHAKHPAPPQRKGHRQGSYERQVMDFWKSTRL